MLHFFDPWAGGRLPVQLYGAQVSQASMDNDPTTAIATVKALAVNEHIAGP